MWQQDDQFHCLQAEQMVQTGSLESDKVIDFSIYKDVLEWMWSHCLDNEDFEQLKLYCMISILAFKGVRHRTNDALW